MTKQEIEKYNNSPVVAVYSFGLCGLEILAIEYGINDSIIYRFCNGTEKQEKPHKAQIYYNVSGNAYFKYNGKRINLNECLRTNI